MSSKFSSDNTSSCHPKVMNALLKCNTSYESSYGDDSYTKKARQVIKKEFGDNADAYFLITGSAANILGLSTVTKSYNSVVTTDESHLDHGTCGGAQKFIGCNLITLPSINGKITPKQIDDYVESTRDDIHQHIPSVISITQPTELGTVYTLAEMAAISLCAKRNKMYFQVDGARLSNACVALNCSLREISRGVDILSFGGTKNGIAFGDCLIFFDPKLSKDFNYIQKQSMHLLSKMRYISCQFVEYLTDSNWKENATNANKMAAYMSKRLKEETNVIFLHLTDCQEAQLRKSLKFKIFSGSPARFVTSWQTTKEDVDEFVDSLTTKSKL
jgi:threonine aldolase